MSSRELERVEVMGRVGGGELKLRDAAKMLELSYRQVKRLWRRYRQEGSKGLKHGNVGRPSNRSKPRKLRRRVLSLIQKKYSGSEEDRFGPTLAAEHLAEEDGIVLDHDTVRLWMLQEGLWSRQRRRKKHCQRRERKAHFGELVQLDGSFHDWLEERGPRGCLMDMVDDATSETQAGLGKEETIWAAAGVLRAWIEKYGVPRALYTDWKNVYKRKATPGEQLRGEVPVTQFGRMCQKLGIRIIAASSPQAKGRVERIHGVHQDRLIKKLRRKKIASYEAANQYLETQYLPEHNRRFARPAAKPEDYHGRADRPRTASDFPFGDRAHDQQRLGDPARRPLSATAVWAAALWTYAKQGSGLRMGGRNHGGVLPRGAGSLYRAEGANTKNRSANAARREGHGGEES